MACSLLFFRKSNEQEDEGEIASSKVHAGNKPGRIMYMNFPLVTVPEETLPSKTNTALERYLGEISQYEILTREEMDDLAIKVHEKNDRSAAYRLISANLRLVVKVAKDFQKFWMQNFMDLVQEGNIGLIKATKKFDPYKGAKFSYYATYWIRAYILKFLMNNWRLVKLGTTQAQRKLFFSLNKEKKLLESQGFVPEPDLLAKRLKVKRSEVVEMSNRMKNNEVSLESPIGQESDDEQISFIPAREPSIEDSLCLKDMKIKLHDFLRTLQGRHNDKERMILEKRLLTDDPLTLQTISEMFGVSRERIRQIEAGLLKKIRKHIENDSPELLAFIHQDMQSSYSMVEA
jgi:RNA polymerase sigma-32 factor